MGWDSWCIAKVVKVTNCTMPKASASKRPYTKHDETYWGQPRRNPPVIATVAASSPAVAQALPPDAEPMFDGNKHFSAVAACGGGDVATTSYRDGAPQVLLDLNRYPNIQAGIVPLGTVDGNYTIFGAVSLVYSAYFNYALLRNTINLFCDFSVSPIHVRTKNQRVKTFIESWLSAINISQFLPQFFLEYYRSGNVFIYKFSGKIDESGLNMLKRSYSSAGFDEAHAAKSKTVPIRYIILNPMQVYLQRGASYSYGYVRMLSTYEIERLKNPQTEEDKQIFDSFPEDIQRQIKQGGSWRYIYVPLDQNRLYYVFYRKQDYEPLAVPMTFPVLNDIEFKLELRRMDLTLARTMEQVLLLVTTGQKADQHNLATGNRQLTALQNLFQNKAIGRVLVADHTTKAEWLIPDLKDLLGPGKYERVDRDIKEGLQFTVFGDEKFANASVKIKVFIESLKEGRRAFMENFLKPEVKKVCEQMGFRDVPELEFEDIVIQDEALMNRLYVQLAQLGLLTADETMQAMQTGMLPSKEEMETSQQEYRKLRDKHFFEPLAAPKTGAEGRPNGTGGTPAPRKVATPIGQTKAAESDIVRDSPYHFGMTRIAANLVKMGEVRAAVEKGLMKRFKVKELSEPQQIVAVAMAQAVIFNESEEEWAAATVAYIKDGPKDLPKEVAAELDDIRATFDTPEEPIDNWMAGVLARSKVDASGIKR